MRRDEHTGLYHTHYREYNPSLGRWLTPDPAGYQDGQNLYCYYPNVNGVDVLGLMEVRHELVGPVDKQAYPVFYPETWYEYPASFANNSITNLSYGLRNTLMLPFAGAGHATQKVEENVLGGRSINEVETAIGPAIPGPVDEILVPALAASKFFVISGKVTQKTGKYHRMEELEEAVRKIDKISDASQPLSKLSSDKVKLYKQYIRDIEAQTGMKISVGQRHELAKHLRNNSHSKILTQTERDAHRLAFSRKKESLIREWEKNTGQKWPTYSEDVLSGEKGNIFRKEGWKYDAHEVIENSFDSPLEWWNIHPAAAPTAHQGGVHRSAGPANKIFSE
jgi:hypothetical protein